MSEYTTETLANGNVQVTRTYWSFDHEETSVEVFAEIGAYVHKVYTNGVTAQVCEGLSARGMALSASGNGDLESVIRKTLGLS